MKKVTERYGRWALGGLLLAMAAILSGPPLKSMIVTNEQSPPTGFVSVELGLFETEGRSDDVLLATASPFAFQPLSDDASEPGTPDPLADQRFLGEGTTFADFVSDDSTRDQEAAGIAGGYPGFSVGGPSAGLLAMAKTAPSLFSDAPAAGPFGATDRHIELAPREGPGVAHKSPSSRPETSPLAGPASAPASGNAPLPHLGTPPTHRDSRASEEGQPITFSHHEPADKGMKNPQSPPLPKMDWGGKGSGPAPGGITLAGNTPASSNAPVWSARSPGSSSNIDGSFPTALALLETLGAPATDPSLQTSISSDRESVTLLDTFAGPSSEVELADPSAIPEPATLALIGLGLVAVAFSRRRRTPA